MSVSRTQPEVVLERTQKCTPMANTVAAASLSRSDASLVPQACHLSQDRASSSQAPPRATSRFGDREIAASWERGSAGQNPKCRTSDDASGARRRERSRVLGGEAEVH